MRMRVTSKKCLVQTVGCPGCGFMHTLQNSDVIGGGMSVDMRFLIYSRGEDIDIESLNRFRKLLIASEPN